MDGSSKGNEADSEHWSLAWQVTTNLVTFAIVCWSVGVALVLYGDPFGIKLFVAGIFFWAGYEFLS